MDWTDEGILIAVRRHGETAAIAEVLTVEHGRHLGVVHGGAGRKMAPVLQPGAQLAVTWRARLEDHLGSFRVEPIASRAAHILNAPERLAGLGAASALISWALPEREPQAEIYAQTHALMDQISSESPWLEQYVLWELTLLGTLGFGLDLSRCAVTGESDDLAYVSPRSGKAVSKAGAGEWAPRLLPLPPFLHGRGPATPDDIVSGLELTAYFLQNWLGAALDRRELPPARARLGERFKRAH